MSDDHSSSSFAFRVVSIDEANNLISDIKMDAIERRIEADPEPAIFRYYMRFLLSKAGPFITVIFWFCILLTGIFYGFHLLSLTIFSFKAPSGTDGYTADAKMDYYFSERANSRQLLIYYECISECEHIQWSPFKQFVPLYPSHNASYVGWTLNNMSHALMEWGTSQGDIYESYTDFYQTFFSYGLTNISLPPYLVPGMPENQILAGLASKIFISASNKSAIGILSYDNTKKQIDKNNFIDDLNSECAKISKLYGNDTIRMSMTGESALIKAMNEEARTDVKRKDTLTIPVALCVLALIVRSWRLMFIPLLTFGTSICAAFSLMRPFAEYVINVNPFCPNIMMSVTIAMSIDYSLFLLSRYREEVERNGSENMDKESMIAVSRAAIRQTTRWSGKVIALSGCILSLTYFGLCFYPMEVLQSIGLGAGLAIVCTILVNLTLTPALMLIFPYFFSQFGWAGCPCKYFCKKQHDEPLIAVEVEAPNNPYSDEEDHEFADLYAAVNKDDPCERCWYFCGSKTTLFPWSILVCVVVYAAIAPFGWQFTKFERQLADTLIFPRDSPYTDTYNGVLTDFSAGFVAPWYILIPKKKNQANISTTEYSDYLNETGLMIEQVFNSANAANYDLSIQGIGFFGSNSFGYNKAISQQIWQNNITCANINCNLLSNKAKCYNCSQINQTFQYLLRGKISSDGTASYYQMTSAFDPYFEGAIDFVSSFRGWLNAACNEYEYECYLSGGSIDEVDSVNTIYANFPAVLGAIVCFVFCLMGCVFKSVFVPFRLFITIAVPMTFVYGLAVMVYQFGALSSLNVDALANTDGLYWLIPVMTVTILIGLALDYDIFLFARIYEYRVMGGVPTHEAIVRGVYKTGSIITAAGIIMGIAFCGLLLSQIPSLNQTGFIMVVAVLVDTFIIRTSLVPAVLSIAKEVNWWPGLNPQCKNNQNNEDLYDLDSSKHINSHYSINANAIKPLRSANAQNNHTLDETM